MLTATECFPSRIYEVDVFVHYRPFRSFAGQEGNLDWARGKARKLGLNLFGGYEWIDYSEGDFRR